MLIIRDKYDQNYYENFLYKGKEITKRNKNRLKEILIFHKKGKLFEIGCAKGEFLNLAKKYFNFSGIDLSDYAINCAKKKIKKKVTVKNIINYELLKNNYEVIVAFNLLEHIKDPSIVIKKVYQGLKKNGIFIGSMPNNSGILGRAFTIFSNTIDKTHCSTFAPKIWHQLFKKARFKKIIFFGEIMPTKKFSWYIKGKYWYILSWNLVFICIKE